MVFETLAEIRERGITVLLVEQRAQRTVAFADRTYLMANGDDPADDDARRCGRHRDDGGGLPLVNALAAPVLATIDAQVIVDAIGLGATYALMAVGIGLVFGVLRLVNFAYGQLIMAGAYTLAYTSAWPVAWSIVACFAVVIALSLAMERAVFRPLREQSPDGDARHHVRDLVRPAERRAALRHPRRHDRRAGVLARRRSTTPIDDRAASTCAR